MSNEVAKKLQRLKIDPKLKSQMFSLIIYSISISGYSAFVFLGLSLIVFVFNEGAFDYGPSLWTIILPEDQHTFFQKVTVCMQP